MTSRIRNIRGLSFSLGLNSAFARRIVSLALLLLTATPSLADGCFVFRWNKAVDINEPTQKAIIVYDQGREDLLLQVKYEGPLEDFGWLVPVPSLPTVERGSMEPFYELSELTQKQFGGVTLSVKRGGEGGEPDRVRVIETKTVGAYEVAILSSKDAGSLRHWLESHGYSVPQDRSILVEEYVRQGWYFIAARIQLDRDPAFKLVSTSSPTNNQAQTRSRQVLQQRLSSGELHPLRISFDTPRCIFPLKISAVGGKSSQVSLYVLSAEPLLNKFIFDRRMAKLHQEKVEYEKKAAQRQGIARTSMLNSRRLQLATQMYALTPLAGKGDPPARDWSLDDIDAIAAESELPTSLAAPDETFYSGSPELLQTMHVPADKLARCAKVMDRLVGKGWHLTKQVYTFRPEEMHDLEFQPAVPVLAALLPFPEGRVAAGLLFHCGPAAVPVLLSACRSTNPAARINASAVLQSLRDERLVEPLLSLLNDPVPNVRLNAVMASARNWDPRFNDALFRLLRDPQPQVRWQAAQWLTMHETRDRTPRYLKLLSDPDLDVPARALQVLTKINPDAVPRTDLVRLLGVPRMDVVSQSLNLLQGAKSAFQTGPPVMVLGMPGLNPEQKDLSSLEAAPLTTNQLTLARLAGLKILHQNADADAMTLALPLLRNTNSLVRNRAFALLRSKTGQDFPLNDPIRWETWWTANKAAFQPR